MNIIYYWEDETHAYFYRPTSSLMAYMPRIGDNIGIWSGDKEMLKGRAVNMEIRYLNDIKELDGLGKDVEMIMVFLANTTFSKQWVEQTANGGIAGTKNEKGEIVPNVT